MCPTNNMGRIANYTKTISQYFTASLIPMVLNLAINPLVAIYMEPEDFAITGYFLSFTTLVSPIIAFYMIHYYNKRYFELDDAGRSHMYALVFKMLIFFSAIVTGVCTLAIYLYIKQQSEISFATYPYLYMVMLVVPLTGIYNLQLAKYKMERKSKQFMNISVMKGVLGVVLTLLFVVIIPWGAFGKLLGPLLLEIAYFAYILVKNKDVWKVKNTFSEVKPILLFCWPLVLGASLGYFSNGYDKAVLATLGNNTEFGYYCVGASIAGYLTLFTSSLSATFQPDIYEAIIKDNRPKLFKVAALQWVMILGVVILFIAFCPLVIKILTAGRYMQSTGYARLLACVCLANSIYYIINDYTIARGLPRFYLYTTIIGSGLIILCIPIFVDWLGYYGGALANIASFVALSIINLILLLIHKTFQH